MAFGGMHLTSTLVNIPNGVPHSESKFVFCKYPDGLLSINQVGHSTGELGTKTGKNL